MNIYIGIDPGKGGGVAILSTTGKVVGVIKMPETPRDVIDLFSEYESNAHAVLERVHSLPQQGHVGAFTFGRGYERCVMGLTAALIPFDEVSPQRWQKAMACLSKGDKNVTKRRAQQLFPTQKITHAIADALLIAEYCRRLHEGILTHGATRISA